MRLPLNSTPVPTAARSSSLPPERAAGTLPARIDAIGGTRVCSGDECLSAKQRSSGPRRLRTPQRPTQRRLCLSNIQHRCRRPRPTQQPPKSVTVEILPSHPPPTHATRSHRWQDSFGNRGLVQAGFRSSRRACASELRSTTRTLLLRRRHCRCRLFCRTRPVCSDHSPSVLAPRLCSTHGSVFCVYSGRWRSNTAARCCSRRGSQTR